MSGLYTKLLQNFYKTTPMRNGIVAWYPFEKNAYVLEQSNGALTEWLQSKCQKTASFSESIPENGKVDYIVVVDPIEITEELLCKYRNALNSHGKLILAFENPFGLQYFGGKRNMRTQLPFTFRNGESKKEVQIRLRNAGFNGQKWYYPFPNHYFTREVYSQNHLPNEFLNHRFSEFLEDDYTKIFDERELWREVIRNSSFEFLCSSYFVEARICGDDASCDIDYAAVTSYRERDRAFVTTIHNDGTAKKAAIYKEGIARLQEMERNHHYLQSVGVNCVPVKLKNDSLTMPRLNLPTLWDWWTQKLSESTLDKEKLFSQNHRIRDAIYKSSQNGRLYWELVPANCFYDEVNDDLIFFDQEFSWENPNPDIAVVRSLWLLGWSDGSPVFDKTRQWLEELKSVYRLTDTWDNLLAIAKDETHLFVFNPSETRQLEESALRAVKRVEYFRGLAESERGRFARFRTAVVKLRDYGVNQVVVYGYGARGKTFVNVLEMEEIDIVRVIDNNPNEISAVKSDAVVVTQLEQAEKIANELSKYTESNIFVLEDLL